MKRIGLLIFLFIVGVVLSCNTKSRSSAATSLLPSLLGTEDGSDGCTISGLGTSFKAGYTEASSTAATINYREANRQYYAVVRVKGAQNGTVVNFTPPQRVQIYSKANCPLNFDVTATSKTPDEFSSSDSGITFNKIGTYLVYIVQRENPGTSHSVVLTGTANDPNYGDTITPFTISDSPTVPTASAPFTFAGSCTKANDTNVCINRYGAGMTTCPTGFTTAVAACATANNIGSCIIPQEAGYRVYIAYKPVIYKTLETACKDKGNVSTSIQTPP